MAWCLNPQFIKSFKKGLVNKEIDPNKLANLNSEERHAFLEKFVGKENALQVNSLFESKLLLKNQKAGYIAWAKRTGGMTPEVKRDLISRIEKLDKVLNPEEEKAFLRDLAETKLGVRVTETEAKTISDLSNKVSELRSKTDVTKSDVPLGRAMLDITDYVNKLGGKKADLLTNVAGVPRSLMASLDLSAPLNQGWGMISRKRFYTSLGTMFKSAFSKGSFRDLQAEIITHPKYDLAKKGGLRLTDLGDKLEMREEQFMSNLLDKVPGITQSQRAYTAFLNKLRLDSFSDLVKKAEVAGEDVGLGSKATEDLAKVVNNFTGGARVGKFEQATPLLNAAFFSPRKIKSTLEMMNPINYINPKISKTARLEATRNMIGSLSLSAGVISLYSLLTGKKQEADPTSSQFGKIVSGDTKLDVSGGNATYLNLLSRLISGRIKNSSGISTKLGTGYAETSGFDLISQFVRYKLSPNASLLVDTVAKENAIGEKKSISQSILDRFKPMFANSVAELLKSDTDNKFALALAGLFGAGLNTYSNETNWSESTGKELNQFKEKVGENQFKKANDKFNEQYDNWFKKTVASDSYKNLSDEGKKALITKKKDQIKQEIFKENKFKYKTPSQTSEGKQEKDIIKNLLNFKLVKSAQAAEQIVNDVERQKAIAMKYRKEHPEWYTNQVGEEGEIKLFGKSLGTWPIGLKQSPPPKEIKDQVMKTSKKYKVDPALISAMLWQESGYKPNAQNGDDRGIAQINSKAHPEVSDKQAYNREFAVNWMIKEVASLIKHFNGDISRAVAAYNVGRGGANIKGPEKFGGGPNGQTYINNVSRNLTDETIKRLGLKISSNLASK